MLGANPPPGWGNCPPPSRSTLAPISAPVCAGSVPISTRQESAGPDVQREPLSWLRYADFVAKTLVIAEKPSVARDLAAALPGTFQKNESHLESDDYVVTYAVGHLVELADPEEYDERFKKWRMADLPIVPETFRLRPRDGKSKKQLKEIEKLMLREDIDRIVNACDAGREGELIFAYIYESVFGENGSSSTKRKKRPEPKPVVRLWINSMTKQAIREGFDALRPGEQMEPLERAARSRSEADWLVGMNATRAATIRGRAWVGGVV